MRRLVMKLGVVRKWHCFKRQNKNVELLFLDTMAGKKRLMRRLLGWKIMSIYLLAHYRPAVLAARSVAEQSRFQCCFYQITVVAPDSWLLGTFPNNS